MSPTLIVDGKTFRDGAYFTGGTGEAQREDATGRGLLESWEWHCASDSGVRVPGPQLFLAIFPGFYHIYGELPGKQLEGSPMSQAIPGSPGETLGRSSCLREGCLFSSPERRRGGRGGLRQAVMIVLKSGQDSSPLSRAPSPAYIELRGFGNRLGT